jgi:hypothetical protein
MIESVFKNCLEQNIIESIEVQEVLPSKGKPARKITGSATVWIVKFAVGEKQMTLESARGGSREWASLSNLDKWLKSCGIKSYVINHAIDNAELMQQPLIFAKD